MIWIDRREGWAVLLVQFVALVWWRGLPRNLIPAALRRQPGSHAGLTGGGHHGRDRHQAASGVRAAHQGRLRNRRLIALIGRQI
jgi:hypothetical protein